MPFLELTVPCLEPEQPRYEHALEDVGALALTTLDANADTDNEHAILEPAVGPTPLRDAIALHAQCPPDPDAPLHMAASTGFDPTLAWLHAACRTTHTKQRQRAR